MFGITIPRRVFIILCVLGVLTLFLSVYQFFLKDMNVVTLDYSGKDSFMDKALAGKLRYLEVAGQEVRGFYYEKETGAVEFKTMLPYTATYYVDDYFYSSIESYLGAIYKKQYPTINLRIVSVEARAKLSLETYLFYGIAFLFVGFITVYVFYRFIGRPYAEQKKFLDTSARMFRGEKVHLSDVAGIDETKNEVTEIIDFAKHGADYKKAGARIPKGVILSGPPGCGKTYLTKAMASEAGIPVFGVSGSEFVEMYVGVGASRIRALFNHAKQNAPCFVVIDEADAVLKIRAAGLDGGSQEQNQTTCQILTEMDGFESGEGIMVLALTNRLDMLDPAAIRPGRFDRKLVVSWPDAKGREAILKVHTKKKPLAPDVDLKALGQSLKLGTSGADIENICNEAAIFSVREMHEQKKTSPLITSKHLEEAIYKTLYGPERKSRLVSDEQKRETAYHEAGHAIVTKYCKYLDPVSIVTVVPRGEFLGFVDTRPEKEIFSETRERIEEKILMYLGGLASEEIFLGSQTTGVKNDLANVTLIKFRAKYQLGMSDLGPVGLPFDVEDMLKKGYFNETIMKILEDLGREAKEDLEKAKAILRDHEKEVKAVVEKLMVDETLNGRQFEEVLEKAKI